MTSTPVKTSALIYEATASARSQPVASLLTLAMVAGMCVAVLLTTGRTAATQDAVMASIDSMDTRSIVVRADATAMITPDLIDRLHTVLSVAAVAGLGPPVDARNARVPDGTKVPVRRLYGDLIATDDLWSRQGTPASVAIASTTATRELGLVDGQGGLITDDGDSLAVVAGLQVPSYLSFLEPLVIMPPPAARADTAGDEAAVLTVVVIVVRFPRDVAAVSTVVDGMLAGIDPSKVNVQTSSQLAAIRSMVSGELDAYGHRTVLGILLTSVALTMINLLALVTMRRRDFGRRRALGATRPLIVGLLLTQVGILATLGVVVGTAISAALLLAGGNALPPATFIAAVGITALLAAVIAALPPALLAARRDPLYELRVP
nr:hypothetical protein GCM10020063_090810 [Dactylosporangium thailandense]